MRKLHSIAALCGDGLRPELQKLFDRMAVDPHSELFVRHDGMLQSGPDPKSEAAPVERAVPEWPRQTDQSAKRTTERSANPAATSEIKVK